MRNISLALAIAFTLATLSPAEGRAQGQAVCSGGETQRIQFMYQDVLVATIRGMQTMNMQEMLDAAGRAQQTISGLSPSCRAYVYWLDAQLKQQMDNGYIPDIKNFGGQTVYRSGNNYVMPGYGSCIGANCVFD